MPKNPDFLCEEHDRLNSQNLDKCQLYRYITCMHFLCFAHAGTNVEGTCPYRFDGPEGVLAHAYYPEDGRAHFDEDETFTHGTSSGTNLLYVAVHEFGHSLGLKHTNIKEAVMYPYYTGYAPVMKLHSDDIAGIQYLYGKKTKEELF